MAEASLYELWNGKKVLGYYITSHVLAGSHVLVPEVSTFKQSYSGKTKYIKVPITARVIIKSNVEYHVRIVLDVRRKSKRQIEVLTRSHML